MENFSLLESVAHFVCPQEKRIKKIITKLYYSYACTCQDNF